MPESPLELRSWWIVALGYVLAPVVAISALWLSSILPILLSPQSEEFDPAKVIEFWVLLLAIGGSVFLTVEVLIITPVLIGFDRYRWRWLNGWSAAAIGFGLGALPWLLIGIWPAPDPGQSYIVGDIPLILDGQRTWAGWGKIFGDAAMMGSVGLIGAVTFRLVGIRRTHSSD